jgi:hypothetical protein
VKVLWASRHSPVAAQVKELQRLFGAVEITHDERKFTNVEDLVERYRAGGFSEMVFIGPLSILELLCLKGLRPLRAKLAKCTAAEAEINYNGRWRRFLGYKRALSVTVLEEDVKPNGRIA